VSKFLVYRASAGSGKTFMLVRKYLQQIFQSPADYRRILAVTFTNKAADEMKGRILLELDILDRNPAQSKHIEFLTRFYNQSDQWVQKTAGRIKSRMLHDYTRISVGTIDSFFQQVLRAFARESGLSSTFQLELDTDLVLQKFSKHIFSEAATNSQLMSWLVEWVNERLENSETWHKLESDLVRLGYELLKEDILNSYVADASAVPSPDQIIQLRDFCRRTIKEFNDSKDRIATDAALIIDKSTYSIDDFSHGMGGPAGFLLKLSGNTEGPKTRSLESLNNPDKWVSKKKAERNAIIGSLYPDLNLLMGKAIRLFDESSKLFNSAKAVNKNLYALGFASFLFDYFRSYFNENNQLLLSLSQPLVNQIIGDNPSPFIYEKTGTWYNHFLIDEFQDTSDLQWKNFKPLIIDSLSADGLSMIVGDIKQSLYRWRNSNWRLLHEKAVIELKAFGSTFEPLDTNQRSRSSIIEFNNLVFSILPQLVAQKLDIPSTSDGSTNEPQADIISEVFQESIQQSGQKAGLEGRVEVRFFDKTDKENEWKDQLKLDLPQIVDDLLVNKGYRQEDITFLVRKNTDADLITRMLSDVGNDWTFISSDVFRIENSRVINMILNAMRFMSDPSQTLYRDLFLWDTFVLSHAGEIPEAGFQQTEMVHFQRFIDNMVNSDLLTITDELIKMYNLDYQESDLAYIFQFRDQIKSCMNKGISHLAAFLNWWDASGHKQMLASESLGSSMRLMTIHKSKGLSAPVIIIPYCNWEFNHSAARAPWLWASTDNTPFNQVRMIPVKYDSLLEQSYFSDRYLIERTNAYLDNINLLYVAFTRAIDVLIIFCTHGNGFKSVGDAMYASLKDNLNEEGIFKMGSPDFKNQNSSILREQEIHLTTPMITGNLKSRISHRPDEEFAGTRFGKSVHHVLENVQSKSDLAVSVKKSVTSGYFTAEEAIEVEIRISQLFNIEQMSDWFSGNWEVLNEASILLPQQGEKRPDRVMIRENQVVVLDYKTGVYEPKHEKQVQTYMKYLSEMGYHNVTGYLLYLDESDLIEVRFPTKFVQPDPKDPVT
jgi:ATP-dependent exoDNAse (exonuclease V) beta subunit